MKVKKGQNIRSEGRSRVFLPIMQEIGFEDCDSVPKLCACDFHWAIVLWDSEQVIVVDEACAVF